MITAFSSKVRKYASLHKPKLVRTHIDRVNENVSSQNLDLPYVLELCKKLDNHTRATKVNYFSPQKFSSNSYSPKYEYPQVEIDANYYIKHQSNTRSQGIITFSKKPKLEPNFPNIKNNYFSKDNSELFRTYQKKDTFENPMQKYEKEFVN